MDPAPRSQKCFNLWCHEESENQPLKVASPFDKKISLFTLLPFFVSGFKANTLSEPVAILSRRISTSSNLFFHSFLPPAAGFRYHSAGRVRVWGLEGVHLSPRHVASAPHIACQNTRETPELLSARSNRFLLRLPFFSLPAAVPSWNPVAYILCRRHKSILNEKMFLWGPPCGSVCPAEFVLCF